MTETVNKALDIIEINVNSLIRLNRRYSLCNFINKYLADKILLNETKLNVKNKI